MNYWKVSGLRVSYDSVVSVDWADDGMVEDVILQGRTESQQKKYK